MGKWTVAVARPSGNLRQETWGVSRELVIFEKQKKTSARMRKNTTMLNSLNMLVSRARREL
jgi:hypothetical protein